MNAYFMRMTSRLLIPCILSLAMPVESAYAGMMGADKAFTSVQAQSERERIRVFMARADVLKEMQSRGVDANSANARVAALTDEEVHKIAGKLDTLPAGGDILGTLLFIFIVLLVTDILGLTKVFPFTRAVR